VKETVEPLKDCDGQMVSVEEAMCELLNECFRSVRFLGQKYLSINYLKLNVYFIRIIVTCSATLR